MKLTKPQIRALLEMPADGSMVFEFRPGMKTALMILSFKHKGLLERCCSIKGKQKRIRNGYRLTAAGIELRRTLEASGKSS